MKKKLFLLLCALLTTVGMWAQTDVTSEYITNPGFESCTETTTNAAASGSAAPLVIDGDWTQSSSAPWSSSAVVAYGGTGKVNGVSAPSADNAGNSGKTLGVSVGWSGVVTYRSSSAVTLPAGRYKMTIHAYNNLSGKTQFKSLNGFVPTSGSSFLSSKTSFTYAAWENDVIEFDLGTATEGKFQIGGQAISGGSGENAKVFFDNITLTYTSAENAYAATKAEAAETYNDATYASVTGSERTDLKDLLDADVSGYTEAEYFKAVNDIKTAVSAFTAAKTYYDEYAAEYATATLLGTDVSGVAAPTTASAALTAAHSINVLNYNKVVAEEYEDVSASTLGAWTDVNVTSRRGQHWDGTTDGSTGTEYFEMNSGYYNNSWTMSRSQTVNLAAGKYILKVACRASTSASATLSVTIGETTISTISGHQGDTGKGITTSGVASYDGGTFANSNNGRGFEWKFIPFELAETGNATLSFTAEGHALHQFVSFTSLALLTDPKVAARTSLLNKINEATNTRKSANEGPGIFQIPAAAGTTFGNAITTAQGVYDNEDAPLDQINTATSTLNTAIEAYEATTLNAPAAEKRYCIVLSNNGSWTYDGKAITYLANARNDMGNYNVQYLVAPNANYAQAIIFTQVEGNTYKMSQIDVEGNERYICTGKQYTGGNTSQIRTITDASKALVVKIEATGTANIFNIYNTEANQYIGSQDAGVFTVNSNKNFTISEASKATAKMQVSGVAKMGTFCAPFDVEIPDGVKAYTLSEGTNESWVHMNEVSGTKIAAGTPVLLTSDSKIDEAMEGYSVINAPDNSGLLQGAFVLTDVDKDAGNYLLQYQDGECAFYLVNSDGKKIGANRCYLHMEESGETPARIVIGGGDDPTAINAVEATAPEANTLKDGKYLIGNKIVLVKNGVKYGANGQKLN